MYSNSYGYSVYKRTQINIGDPYQIKAPAYKCTSSEEAYDEDDSAMTELDKELHISQDIVHKAKEEASFIRHEVKLEAERILSEAQEEANHNAISIEQKAKEEGYRHGEVIAQQHYNELLIEAQDFKDRCKSEYEDTLASLEQDMVELVLNIAAKVVGDEVRNNRESILGIVREAIHSCSNHEHVVLKVSAEDYGFVIENQERLLSMIKGIDEMEIKKDGTLTKGSCMIDTGYGSVDGSADTRLELIRQAFFEVLQNVKSD